MKGTKKGCEGGKKGRLNLIAEGRSLKEWGVMLKPSGKSPSHCTASHHPQFIRAETAGALFTDCKKPPTSPDAGKLQTAIQEEKREIAERVIAEVRGMVANGASERGWWRDRVLILIGHRVHCRPLSGHSSCTNPVTLSAPPPDLSRVLRVPLFLVVVPGRARPRDGCFGRQPLVGTSSPRKLFSTLVPT